MLAATAFAAAFAIASVNAAPIKMLNTVEASLSTPNTTQTNEVTDYFMNGNAGACGWYSKDSDVVVGLPTEFYSDLGAVSPYCGSFVVVKNNQNNKTVVAMVADASASNDTLSLSQGTWWALNGSASSLKTVNWRFANEAETAEAKAALSSSSSSAPSSTTYSAPSSTSYSAPSSSSYSAAPSSSSAAAQVEYKQATTSYAPKSSSTWTPQSTTTSAWKAPTTSYAPKETTTSAWVAPKSTWTTTQAAAATAKSYSSSSSSSGSYSGQATYFYQGGVAGACGTVHSDSDYIVALDSAMYGSGGYCGKSLTIYGNGKSVTASVADECPTCASSGSLDLSLAAFEQLASTDAGVVSITWSWN
ncbi:SPOSA6832_00128, partial [Sporobolomyces salmonicolor]